MRDQNARPYAGRRMLTNGLRFDNPSGDGLAYRAADGDGWVNLVRIRDGWRAQRVRMVATLAGAPGSYRMRPEFGPAVEAPTPARAVEGATGRTS